MAEVFYFEPPFQWRFYRRAMSPIQKCSSSAPLFGIRSLCMRVLFKKFTNFVLLYTLLQIRFSSAVSSVAGLYHPTIFYTFWCQKRPGILCSLHNV